MTGRIRLSMAIAVMMVWSLPTWAAEGSADGIQTRLEAARVAYQKNDLPRTAHELEEALMEAHSRIGKAVAEAMPPAPTGWQMEDVEIQGLGDAGGGLTVTRAYFREDPQERTSLNISLFIDSPAVEAALALLGNPSATAGQQHMKRLKVNGEDALMRYDPTTHTGEITVVLDGRILLEINGDGLSRAEQLEDMAKGWNIVKIRGLTAANAG